MVSVRQAKILEDRKAQKRNEIYTLIGLGLALGSWGYSVISPEPNIWFGSALLALAFVATIVGVCRAFELQRRATGTVSLLLLIMFGFFDWYVLVVPQRGKPFKQLLVSGYHLTDDCGNRSASEPLPSWLQNQSTAWQAQTEQLIVQKLDYKNLQMWRGAVIIGLASDANLTAYQCTLLSIKVEALETIISKNYDPKLAHQEYQGPLYWLESVDGKVDISEALKNGGTRFTIHKAGGNTAITGHMPKQQ